MVLWKHSRLVAATALTGFVAVSALPATAAPNKVVVTVENLAPANGNFLTPVWIGFHDGTFDLYDRDAPATDFGGLEPLAEDGNTGPLSDRFAADAAGEVQGTITGPTIPPIAPGEAATMTFSIDDEADTSRYFSYASMVIPSNDAFIANGNPLAHSVFSGDDFVGTQFVVLGADVLDAGTEVNDESPENTAFFGQATPDTGVDEDGVVMLHEGFMDVGSGGILDSDMFAGADFTQEGYEVARITVQPAPIPPALALFATALAGLGAFGVRKRSRSADAV